MTRTYVPARPAPFASWRFLRASCALSVHLARATGQLTVWALRPQRTRSLGARRGWWASSLSWQVVWCGREKDPQQTIGLLFWQAHSGWAAVYADSGLVCPPIGYEFADPTAPPAIPSSAWRGDDSLVHVFAADAVNPTTVANPTTMRPAGERRCDFRAALG